MHSLTGAKKALFSVRADEKIVSFEITDKYLVVGHDYSLRIYSFPDFMYLRTLVFAEKVYQWVIVDNILVTHSAYGLRSYG